MYKTMRVVSSRSWRSVYLLQCTRPCRFVSVGRLGERSGSQRAGGEVGADDDARRCGLRTLERELARDGGTGGVGEESLAGADQDRVVEQDELMGERIPEEHGRDRRTAS